MDKIGGFHTYNLGNHDAIKLKDLIRIVGEVMGIEPKVKQVNPQAGDVEHTLADISKAKMELGYNPHTSIHEGVKKFVEWYKTERTS